PLAVADLETGIDGGRGIAEVYKEVWDSMPKDANGDIDVNKAISSLTPKERIALKTLKDKIFNDPDHTDKIRINSEMRGETFQPHGNYFPRRVIQTVRSGKDAPGTPDSFVDEILSTTQRNLGTRSKSSFGRTGQLFFPDLDIEKVLLKHVEEVNRDFYLTEA